MPLVSGSGSPAGTAGGDLSGLYPNPTVAKVEGVTVSGTAAANTTLVASGANAAAWGTLPGSGITNPGNPNQRLNGKGNFGQSSVGIGVTARGFLLETLPLQCTSSANTLTAGELNASIIGVPGGQPITGGAFFVTTGSAAMTHFWLLLYDTSFSLVAQSADTPAAVNVTNAFVNLSFTATVTPSNDTAYYIGLLGTGGGPIIQANSISTAAVGAFSGGARMNWRQTALAAIPNPATPVATNQVRWIGVF